MTETTKAFTGCDKCHCLPPGGSYQVTEPEEEGPTYLCLHCKASYRVRQDG